MVSFRVLFRSFVVYIGCTVVPNHLCSYATLSPLVDLGEGDI